MESYFIWIITFIVAISIILPYFLKFKKLQNKDRIRKLEAQRLGSDKPIAQYPQIDELNCIGCASCVDACPEGDVLGIVSGKATIINGLKCVGHGKCAEACPVGAIQVGLGDISKRDDIPFYDVHGQTNIPGIYIAGELGGLALIRNAIKQGNEVVEHLSKHILPDQSPSDYDLVIVGAGPAGMSAALTAEKNKLSYLLIDHQKAGGTILQYPRKKLVMTQPVELPLYGILDKPEYSKEELLEIWKQVQKRFSIAIHTNEKLLNITRPNGILEVQCSTHTFKTRNVVLALGRRGMPRKLNIPGEHLPKVMYKLLDATSYENEHILVVGGGDSAIEAAIGLARQPGTQVTISYRKENFFRIKKRNEERLKELTRTDTIKILYNSNLVRIEEKQVEIDLGDRRINLSNDYIFIFIGGEAPFGLLKKIGIQFGSTEN